MFIGERGKTMVSGKALLDDFNMQVRSSPGFTNPGCLHCTILKALYGFKEKRTHNSIFLSKCSK